MKKSAVFLLFLLIPATLFCFGKKSEKNDESKIYSMTEEEIVKGNSATKAGVRRNSVNNKSTITVTRFNGVDCIATLTPKNQNIDITLSTKVSRGDLRIVLCDSENIIYEFDINEKDQAYSIPSSSSKYYLKAVGDNANYTIELEYKTKKLDLPSFDSTIL